MNKYKDDITHILENYSKNLDTRFGQEVCIREGSFNLLAQEVTTYFMSIISNLEAKVYAYEKIIANSNFKTILEEPKTNTNSKKTRNNKGEE